MEEVKLGNSPNGSPLWNSPCLSDLGILALVDDEWESPWMVPHQILTRLSRYFHVVWCSRAPWWRESLRSRLRQSQQKFDHGFEPNPGLTIYRPERWLPAIGRPRFLAEWTERERLRRAQQLLLARGCRRTILYLWRPRFERAIDLIPHDVSCYHIEDEYTFSEVEQPIDEQEARVISRVHQVFIHSPALLEKKGKFNLHTAVAPNGVDYHAYVIPHNEPLDLQAIPHPRIGYVGRIKPQLDLSLLIALAERHQDWSFVFVGPCQSQNFNGKAVLIHKLSQLPNVFFLGAKPVGELPAYTQHLDVCVLCYELTDYTKFIYPLKLHEYLASGRPVVGSPIRSLEEFAHLIRLARTPNE